MSKMREAFEKWNESLAWPFTGREEKAAWAGYQAAIAAVKEGGATLEVVEELVDNGDYDQGNELICKLLKKLVLGDKLYKLPED